MLLRSSFPLVGGSRCGSKTSGRKNGVLCENGAIDELERETATAYMAMAMVGMARCIIMAVIIWGPADREETKATVYLEKGASANGRIFGKVVTSTGDALCPR